MSLGSTYLVLLATIAVLAGGLWQLSEGRAVRSDAARRLQVARERSARRSMRAAVDLRLRRIRPVRVLQTRLAVAGIGVGPSIALLALCAGVTVVYMVGSAMFGRVVAVVAVAGAIHASGRYVDYRQTQLREAFVAQLPELAWTMSNAAAAGLAMPRTIELAAAELGPPASGVLQRVVEELRVGQPLDRALANLRDRMPSREVAVLVSALTIQQRTGGDIVAALREMSHTLDARKELRREVRTTMAGVVATSWVASSLALVAVLLVNTVRPGVIEEMTHTAVGRVALVLGVGLFALAFWLIRRIRKIET